MAKAKLTVSVREMPQVLAECRHELAEMVRAYAGAESDPRVIRRLREAAAAFEAGVSRRDAKSMGRQK